jgi:hypothetical protein
MVEANISVPTVELMNEGGDEFHTYSIQIDAADGTWTIHKRCVLAALVSGTARVVAKHKLIRLQSLQIARCGCRWLSDRTVFCRLLSCQPHHPPARAADKQGAHLFV